MAWGLRQVSGGRAGYADRVHAEQADVEVEAAGGGQAGEGQVEGERGRAAVEGAYTLDVTPTYNWTVSAGTIQSGQGTSTITVDTTGTGGQTITATVDVGGFPRECSTSNSCTTSVTKEAAPSIKFGEYVTPDLSANMAKLDEFVLALQQDPTAQSYIIAYGGKTSPPDDARKPPTTPPTTR